MQTVKKKIRRMKDRLIKRERDRTIVAENNRSMCLTAGERGDGAVARRRKIMRERGKSREMD